MSIAKALKTKNSGVFIDNIQSAFLKNSPAEILDAIQIAPSLRSEPDIVIQEIGLMSWCDSKYIPELKSKIQECVETDKFRTAAVGCQYLFGTGQSKEAIEVSESIFERVEATSDYEFYTASALFELIGCAVDWNGAPNGKYFIQVDKDYLSSTILSVADDLRVSGLLYNEGYVVQFASGLARANNHQESQKLIIEYLEKTPDYSEAESMIYSLDRTIRGIPTEIRSLNVQAIEFMNRDFLLICAQKAKEKAKKSDKKALEALLAYVENF